MKVIIDDSVGKGNFSSTTALIQYYLLHADSVVSRNEGVAVKRDSAATGVTPLFQQKAEVCRGKLRFANEVSKRVTPPPYFTLK